MSIPNEADFTGLESPVSPVLDVRIVTDMTAFESYTAEFGAYSTETVPQSGIGTNQPIQILQRRIKRHRAIITTGTLSGGVTIICNSSQAPLTGANPQGYTLTVSQQTLEVKNQEPLYAIAVGGAGIVSVLDEGWR
jgi:hypothetical protein